MFILANQCISKTTLLDPPKAWQSATTVLVLDFWSESRILFSTAQWALVNGTSVPAPRYLLTLTISITHVTHK